LHIASRFFGSVHEHRRKIFATFERILMNSKTFQSLLLGASLFLATAAFAGEKASVKVYENVKLNAKQSLRQVHLEWTGTGPDVQLNIRKGNDTLLPPRRRSLPLPTLRQAAVTPQSGRRRLKSLTSVFIAGKK